jgi:hypothetical protein
MSIHKRPYTDLFMPGANMAYLRPLEITDIDLRPTICSDTWHGERVSYIPGINRLTDLYILWHCSSIITEDSLASFQKHMNLLRSALDDLPPQLQWRGGLAGPPGRSFGTDAQMANLYLCQLHIRYNLLERMMEVSQKTGTAQINTLGILTERQLIVEDMLEIVQHVPREVIQANGASLVHKIRDIGTALLEQSSPEQSRVVGMQKNSKLTLVLEILKELEGQV